MSERSVSRDPATGPDAVPGPPAGPPGLTRGLSYREHHPLILSLSRAHARGRLDPEDAAQEAWLACLASRPAPEKALRSLRAWLFVVIHNRLGNLRRRANRPDAMPIGLSSDLPPGREDDPAVAYRRGLLAEAIRSALGEAERRLPETTYLAVVLRWVEGRPTAEVAASLGLSEGQVRDRCRRALPELRSIFAGRLGPELLEFAGVGYPTAARAREEVRP